MTAPNPGALARLAQFARDGSGYFTPQHFAADLKAALALVAAAKAALEPFDRLGDVIERYEAFCVENGYPKPDFLPIAKAHKQARAALAQIREAEGG